VARSHVHPLSYGFSLLLTIGTADDDDDEKEKRQAVKDLVQSWNDRLQLITVIVRPKSIAVEHTDVVLDYVFRVDGGRIGSEYDSKAR